MATLYLIATPIGNLSDWSPRAIEVAGAVAHLFCEDTRTTGFLLHQFGIKTPMSSFHLHNEHDKVQEVIRKLDEGLDVALMSDAGTPGISDPGFLATRSAHLAGHAVCAIPGPSAALTALVASGLPSDRFVFEGFLPPKKGRQTRLKALQAETRTMVFFESPFRIVKLLAELSAMLGGGRLACVGRELTKKFEEVKRGDLDSLHHDFSTRDAIKGEFVLVVAGSEYAE